MSEINYEFRKRMTQVHKPNRRMEWAKPSCKDVEVDGSWTVVLPSLEDVVLYNAAKDLVDYFAVSMGVFVKLSLSPCEGACIEYRVDPLLGEKRYRVCVEKNRILLVGSDSKTCARAGYFLEDQMNLNEAPFVEEGVLTRDFLYSPRMVHSGYGLDVFPDEYMRQIAHYGFTALLIYVRSVQKDYEYNDIIDRAARFGLDVYAYSALLSRAYPEGEEGRRFYDGLYGELFRRCPGFQGVVFVGESVEFPSRDPNTSGRLRLDNIGPDGHSIIKKVSPGWYPCCDFHLWINMVKEIIHSVKSDADIVVWSYNWGYQDREKRLELIRKLPEGISLQVTFEMFENVKKDDSYGRSVDYTLFFEGPGQYFVSEAEEAKKQGIRLYSMVNTGGLTWDVGVIPYEPAPYQWLKRYRQMKKAHDAWGLCGTMDTHHFGWYPSFVSDFCKWMFDSPDSDPDAVLRRLAVRDFSEECAEEVLKAWRLFSEGIENLVSTNGDQYGPCRVGPSFPLLLDKMDFVFPSRSGFIHNHNAICDPTYRMYMKYVTDEEKQHQMDCEIRWFSKARDLFREGSEILHACIERIHPSKREDALRMANLGEFISRTAQTAVHVKLWHKDRKQLLSEISYEEKKEIALRMEAVAKAEMENARNTIPLVTFDSRLGYEPSMDYMCDESHLLFKIKDVQRVLDEELALYLK